ncbi:hypothetical protein DFH09DRAFT_1108509 [Mycena vulgaris]|nr:hypothetical protein DFH09DRAFT_1108509 [Mycena vulgaris]
MARSAPLEDWQATRTPTQLEGKGVPAKPLQFDIHEVRKRCTERTAEARARSSGSRANQHRDRRIPISSLRLRAHATLLQLLPSKGLRLRHVPRAPWSGAFVARLRGTRGGVLNKLEYPSVSTPPRISESDICMKDSPHTTPGCSTRVELSEWADSRPSESRIVLDNDVAGAPPRGRRSARETQRQTQSTRRCVTGPPRASDPKQNANVCARTERCVERGGGGRVATRNEKGEGRSRACAEASTELYRGGVSRGTCRGGKTETHGWSRSWARSDGAGTPMALTGGDREEVDGEGAPGADDAEAVERVVQQNDGGERVSSSGEWYYIARSWSTWCTWGRRCVDAANVEYIADAERSGRSWAIAIPQLGANEDLGALDHGIDERPAVRLLEGNGVHGGFNDRSVGMSSGLRICSVRHQRRKASENEGKGSAGKTRDFANVWNGREQILAAMKAERR